MHTIHLLPRAQGPSVILLPPPPLRLSLHFVQPKQTEPRRILIPVQVAPILHWQTDCNLRKEAEDSTSTMNLNNTWTGGGPERIL